MSRSHKHRIFIVDDDTAVRDSLAALIESLELEVELSLFSSGEDFLAALEDGATGCVLLDVRMPGLSGLEVQKQLNEKSQNLAVIIITGHGDVAMAVEAMREGAFHFIEKPFSDNGLIEALEGALKASEAADEETRWRDEAMKRLERLTPRERDVLAHLLRGAPNKIIAYELGISARTVEVHRARVMEKLEAPNLSAVVKTALVAGLDDRSSFFKGKSQCS